MSQNNSFGAKKTLSLSSGNISYFSLQHLAKSGVATNLERFPFSVKVILEALLRTCDGKEITEDDVKSLANWSSKESKRSELPFKPARVILQDFTGVPVLVDLAAMRSTFKRMGGVPKQINPSVPVDLVVDHSVQIDAFGSDQALAKNLEMEFSRNRERYEFLRWGQNAVDNFRVVPPGMGIVHQVNLEFLGQSVSRRNINGEEIALCDSLVGTDSHTTMINALGIVGWGVGGIEAEAVMLGQPLGILTPQVVGMKLSGQLKEGVTATDLTLTITQMLREKGVVDKFVEFYGPGISNMSLADRATISNMAPEYGATMGFFPIDAETLEYLRRTGRKEEDVKLVEAFTKEQGLFRTDDMKDPEFNDSLSLDLSTVEPSLAGPKRPQDRIALTAMKSSFQQALKAPTKQRGFALEEKVLDKSVSASINGKDVTMGHGSVVIAAITSCTNTSNPSVLVAAGLVAKNAVEKGLRMPAYVKTSLAPGSRVVTEYLRESGLLPPLETLGFQVVGYGCTTCIGNSGPLPEDVAKVIKENDLVAASVLSGNRNFEGRIHALVQANYLASPPLVVAYALAGTVKIDLQNDPIGTGSDGKPVYLKDLWPSQKEISETILRSITPAMFEKNYSQVFDGPKEWNELTGAKEDLYPWNDKSTYIQEPPYFEDFGKELPKIGDIKNARVLGLFGDSVTTDHISPAGSIAPQSPAGKYLQENSVQIKDFNSYGSRRGNDRVMTRGTFGNIRLKNRLVHPKEGNLTVHFPSGDEMPFYDAAMRYQKDDTTLIILGGKEYGTGSSRDWAAKGTLLQGVKAVIVESFERIHRANLVGMGVLPLVFADGKTCDSLQLTGEETFDIVGISDQIKPRQKLTVNFRRKDGSTGSFKVEARLDTPLDVNYYLNGGILQTVLRNLL